MPEIPREALSEHFQERMKGRRLHSAVFLTFEFDPGFFEQEVLPVFLDIPLSHAPSIRLVQLEDALRELGGQIAVYYDANALVSSDSGSAKLDVRRIALRHSTGIFHPKNIFLLVEDVEPDEHGEHARSLLIACLSANITRAGWWENVEVCHVEEFQERGRTRLRPDLVSLLVKVRAKAPKDADQAALKEVLKFVRTAEQMPRRSSEGRIHTHFYSGDMPLAEFFTSVVDSTLQGSNLEVISPFFDVDGGCQPLRQLIDTMRPRSVRVFLPRSASYEAQLSPEIYDAVSEMGAKWGALPRDLTRLGRDENAGERRVHAKVYRFFTQNPKREVLFIGSVNLTRPGHGAGGNLESGFLIEVEAKRRPEFWLLEENERPLSFLAKTEEEAAASGGTRLGLVYRWDTKTASVYWDSTKPSPQLRLEARGAFLFEVEPIAPRDWTDLDPSRSARVEDALSETSMFTVVGESGNPGLLLVQEEGMSHKPSMLFHLSVADILRYWSLLTAEQRAAFLEAHAPEVALMDQGADLVARIRADIKDDTLFDRFAGFFHAFGSLERAVRAALDAGRDKEASSRLFGRKYDSLGVLVDRVASGEGTGDDVDCYVLVLCSRQLCRTIERDYQEYWFKHSDDAKRFHERLREAGDARRRQLVERDPTEMGPFLVWFDRWFLQRAEPPLGGDA